MLKKDDHKIVKITEVDDLVLDQIIGIQKEFEILPSLLSKNIKESSDGFLISAHKKDTMKEFISEGGGIYVSQKRNSPFVSGYLLLNTGHTFIKKHPHTKINWINKEEEIKYQKNFSEGSFIYLDQIGVTSQFHGKGIAKKLYDFFENNLEHQLELLVITAIVQHPVNNIRSSLFFNKLNFKEIGKFVTPNWGYLGEVRSSVLAKIIKVRICGH